MLLLLVKGKKSRGRRGRYKNILRNMKLNKGGKKTGMEKNAETGTKRMLYL